MNRIFLDCLSIYTGLAMLHSCFKCHIKVLEYMLYYFLLFRSYFENQWKDYLNLRGIADGQSEPTLKNVDTPEQRDKFYTSVSYAGCGGACGHDAPMIA